MTRLKLIKKIWQKVLERKNRNKGYPSPPEHWLDLNRDGWYESILDIGERCIAEEENPLPSVEKDKHDSEVKRRMIHFLGADSMIDTPRLHRKNIEKNKDIE